MHRVASSGWFVGVGGDKCKPRSKPVRRKARDATLTEFKRKSFPLGIALILATILRTPCSCFFILFLLVKHVLACCAVFLLVSSPGRQMRTSWVMKGIKKSPEGGYVLAFNTPEGPKRLQAKVAVCTAPAHRLMNLEGLRVRALVFRKVLHRF